MTGLILVWALAITSILTGAHAAPSGMAWVPAGEFTPFFKEKPRKGEAGEPRALPVLVPGFWVETRPVTLREFLEFVRTHSEWRKSQANGLQVDSSYLKNWKSDLSPGKGLSSNAPITYVSWFAARAYCQSKGRELPSIAQWERAAGPSPAQDVVWEWVLDFNSVLMGTDDRSQGSEDQGQFCGGGAANSKDAKDYAAFMRYGFRSSLRGNYAIKNLGFRCISGSMTE